MLVFFMYKVQNPIASGIGSVHCAVLDSGFYYSKIGQFAVNMGLLLKEFINSFIA